MVAMPPQRSAISHKNGGPEPRSGRGFEDVDKLRDSSGIVAVISQRSFDGKLTVALFREFERDGGDCRTGFIPEDLLDSAGEMLTRAKARVQEIKRTGNLPFPPGGMVRRR